MPFKYDIVALIELVETRPCLWDKTIEEYKDKRLKQKAWNEVFQCLEGRYNELTNKGKKFVGGKITSKWINVKDAFVKTLKTKSAQEAKKYYIHGHYLQFLLKCYQKENTADLLDQYYKSHKELNDPIIDLHNTVKTEYITPDIETYNEIYEDNIESPKKDCKKVTSKRKLDYAENQIDELKNAKTGNPQTSGMSDDEKFFQSFIPYLKDMTETDKIDFQTDILKSIKKIKLNRSQNLPIPFLQAQIQQEPKLQDCEVSPSKQTPIIIHNFQLQRPVVDGTISSFPDLQQANQRFDYKNIFDAFPR